MYRVIVFSPEKQLPPSWLAQLSSEFEITNIANPESLRPLMSSWQPHILIYYSKKISAQIIKSLLVSITERLFGFVIFAPTYNLREELLSFELGADHYLLYNTPIESVRARLLALGRKHSAKSKASSSEPVVTLPRKTDVLRYGDLHLHLGQGVAKMNGRHIKVTPTQFRLLVIFASHPGDVLTREWIQKNVFKTTKMSSRSIDAHIAKLKRAIPYLQTELVNVYGRGYMLNAREDDAA